VRISPVFSGIGQHSRNRRAALLRQGNTRDE
jgi:hypothetical protein